MSALAIWTLAALALAQGDPSGDPSPEDRFEEARNLFLYQECERAVPLLETLLYPNSQITRADHEALAREYLGACYWWAGKIPASDLEFTAWLLKSPGARLDPFYYPSEMVRHVDDLRQRLVSQGILAGDAPQAPPPTPCPEPEVRERRVEVHHKSRWPLFLPFGVPQFHNGQPVGGVLFATGQGLTLATNIASYVAIELMRGGDGRLSAANYDRARALQTMLYVALGAWAGLYAWSVIDGWRGFEEQTLVEPPVGAAWTPAGTPLVTTTFRF